MCLRNEGLRYTTTRTSRSDCPGWMAFQSWRREVMSISCDPQTFTVTGVVAGSAKLTPLTLPWGREIHKNHWRATSQTCREVDLCGTRGQPWQPWLCAPQLSFKREPVVKVQSFDCLQLQYIQDQQQHSGWISVPWGLPVSEGSQ